MIHSLLTRRHRWRILGAIGAVCYAIGSVWNENAVDALRATGVEPDLGSALVRTALVIGGIALAYRAITNQFRIENQLWARGYRTRG